MTRTKRKRTRKSTVKRRPKRVFMSFVPADSEFADELRQQVEATGLFQVIPFEQSQQWYKGVWNVAHLHQLIVDADAFLATGIPALYDSFRTKATKGIVSLAVHDDWPL